MSVASNRVSGSGMWGMTVDHTILMLRDPDLVPAPIFISLEIKDADIVLVLEDKD